MLDQRVRGLVNQLTHKLDLDDHVTDRRVTSTAEAVVAQRVFSSPVADYYTAAETALRGQQNLGTHAEADRRARDFLRRLLRALDERRPWPELGYQELDPVRWAALLSAPLIGHIDMTPVKVSERLSRGFTKIADRRYGLILRLQTEQIVGLLNNTALKGNVEIHSSNDPAQTRADLHELTGLDIRATGA